MLTKVWLLLVKRDSRGWEIVPLVSAFYPSEFSGIIFLKDGSGLLRMTLKHVGFFLGGKSVNKAVDRPFHT